MPSGPNGAGYSSSYLTAWASLQHQTSRPVIEKTKPAAAIDVASFDAILVAGGQAPMATFETAHARQRKFVEFFEAGKVACALCHGVAILRYAKLSSGEYLAKGKTVTGFANVEEDFADNAVWSMGLLSRDKLSCPGASRTN